MNATFRRRINWRREKQICGSPYFRSSASKLVNRTGSKSFCVLCVCKMNEEKLLPTKIALHSRIVSKTTKDFESIIWLMCAVYTIACIYVSITEYVLVVFFSFNFCTALLISHKQQSYKWMLVCAQNQMKYGHKKYQNRKTYLTKIHIFIKCTSCEYQSYKWLYIVHCTLSKKKKK